MTAELSSNLLTLLSLITDTLSHQLYYAIMSTVISTSL